MRTSFLAALACLLISFSVCKAENEKKRDKILCVVSLDLTYKLEALSVVNTWGRQCDKVLMVAGVNDESLPTEYVIEQNDSIEPYQRTYGDIYAKYSRDFQWVLMASWDSHLIMENVRNILAKYQPTTAYYLGSKDGDAFSSKCGTMINMKALQVFDEKLSITVVPDSLTPEAHIYKTLGKHGVQLVDFCSVKFEKAEIPDSVEKFIALSSGMKKCCTNNYIAMKGATIYENYKIDKLIQNGEIEKTVKSQFEKANEVVKVNLQNTARLLEAEIRHCTDSAESNSQNYTKIEWGKRWDAEWNSFCQVNDS